MPYTINEILAANEATAGQRYLGNLFAERNPLLERLPFDNSVTPNARQSLVYTYSRLKSMRTAQFRDWNTDYAPGKIEREPASSALRALGGAFELDRVFVDADISGWVEENIREQANAASRLLNATIINGDSDGTFEFDGLSKILEGTTSEFDGSSLNLAAGQTDAAYLEGLAGVKKYINRLRSAGFEPVILTNEEAALRLEVVATKLGFVEKRPSNFGASITQYAGVDILDVGVNPSTAGDGGPVIPLVDGLTDVYIVGLSLNGFHGVTLTGSKGVRYYDNFDQTDPGVIRRGEAELVATVALKNTRAAYVMRDVRVLPAA